MTRMFCLHQRSATEENSSAPSVTLTPALSLREREVIVIPSMSRDLTLCLSSPALAGARGHAGNLAESTRLFIVCSRSDHPHPVLSLRRASPRPVLLKMARFPKASSFSLREKVGMRVSSLGSGTSNRRFGHGNDFARVDCSSSNPGAGSEAGRWRCYT